MTTELRPMGVACNLGCTYCYQESVRKANGNGVTKYDLDLMLKEAEKIGQRFTLFGGEALLIPKKDLEKIFSFGFEKFKRNSIQTNGVLLDNDHIKIFKKYNVHVGVSIDGNGSLNDLRVVRGKASNIEETRKATRKTFKNIKKLKENGISVGVIITLHKLNGSIENLANLKQFILDLAEIGVKSGNIHTLEVDSTMANQEIHVLNPDENLNSFISLAKFFEQNPYLNWEPFSSMKCIVEGKDNNTLCIWKNCDHMNTEAVYGIEGDGSLSNCGRTNKEGIDWYKSDKLAYNRYISLFNTPVEMGGCKGCRFWIACGGGCPGESQNGDFRNKTIHCKTQYGLLEYYERKLTQEGKEPITQSKLRAVIEALMLNYLENGKTITIENSSKKIKELLFKPIQIPISKSKGA